MRIARRITAAHASEYRQREAGKRATPVRLIDDEHGAPGVTVAPRPERPRRPPSLPRRHARTARAASIETMVGATLGRPTTRSAPARFSAACGMP